VGHSPHLFLPRPWPQDAIAISPATSHHLLKVLRLGPGAAVSYTDGAGHVGEGHLSDDQVTRGNEHVVPPPPVAVTVAVAPPHDKDRLRFMVEKLGELEVRRVLFLRTRFGTGRIPDQSRAASWAVAALEQSRGAWLLETAPGWTELAGLDPAGVWYADQGGSDRPETPPAEVTVAIGPEGGWAEEEVPVGANRLSLGRTVLRVETAAIVAAGMFRAAFLDDISRY
jgi:16S rRNA (uracil1498-N3)-methyltransferase